MDMDILKTCLECPICTVVPRKMKIFSCLNGHDICEHCFGSLGREDCPQGGCSYGVPGSKKVRARKLETLIEKAELELNCRYSRAGCLEEGLGKDLDEHEAECSFRPVPCLVLGCDDKICLRMLDNHLTQEHQFGRVCKREDGLNIIKPRFSREAIQMLKSVDDDAFCPRAFQFDDGSGKVYICQAVRKRTLYTWLTLICSPSQAKGYICTIRLSNPTINFYNEVQCPIASIDTPPDEVLESGFCLGVTGFSVVKILVTGSQDRVFQKMGFKIEKLE